VHGALIELIAADLLSENVRCNAAHRQNASQRSGEVGDTMARHRHVSSALDQFIQIILMVGGCHVASMTALSGQ
jgi:hypothetical protein